MSSETSAAVKAVPAASIFEGARTSSWRFILLFTVLVFGVITAVCKTIAEEHGILSAIYAGSAHLVTPTLLGAGLLGIVVLAFLTISGRLSFREFGWRREYLVPGVAGAVMLWFVMQAIETIANLAINGEFQLSSWTAAGAATAAGVLIGQALGTAVSEETFFRGFLLPQLRLKFSGMKGAFAIALAVVLSQLAFSLFHVPNLVLGLSGKVGSGFSEIAMQLAIDLAIGLVYAAVYIRTRNLFLVMGIHALQNAGTSFVATPLDPALVMLMLAIAVFAATYAPSIARRLRGATPAPRMTRPVGS